MSCFDYADTYVARLFLGHSIASLGRSSHSPDFDSIQGAKARQQTSYDLNALEIHRALVSGHSMAEYQD